MEDSLAGAKQLPAQVHLCKMTVIRPHSSISLQIVDLTFLPGQGGDHISPVPRSRLYLTGSSSPGLRKSTG